MFKDHRFQFFHWRVQLRVDRPEDGKQVSKYNRLTPFHTVG